jgi:hypothetical protein
MAVRETALSLLMCAITPAVAQAAPARLAVADFDFLDTSFEATDRTAEHAARIEAFDGWLRDGLEEDARVELIALACPQRCTGSAPGLEALSAAAKAAGAGYLLVGQVRKVSTLIGAVSIGVFDLADGGLACSRQVSYRGDTDEAWRHAADFAARDVAANCLP